MSATYSTFHLVPVAHAASSTAVLTYKYDNFRTGQNLNETVLTPSNVHSSQFGKRVSYPVDGNVYAQPLFMPNLTINGSTHNVVFVATEHDSVYAFDADQKSAVAPLWHTSFIDPTHGINTVASSDVNCTDIYPEIGITSTPVIDANTNTLYVVAKTKENGSFFQKIHAIDITTGREKAGSPTVITATVRGTGDGSVNGNVKFDPLQENQRPGLLLLNGVVYISWASHCDHDPYHGWVIGYDATSLQQVAGAVYNATRNGARGGIWQSGGALTADPNGNIYFMTGNGTFDLNTGGKDAGDTLIKLSTLNGLSKIDYFTPFNESCLEAADIDLGSGAPILIPSNSEVVAIGKEGRIYVLNRNKLGKYTAIINPCNNQNLTNVDKVLQESAPSTVLGGEYGTPTYWNGPSGEFIYAGGVHDRLKAFKMTNGSLSFSPTSQSPELFSFPGCNAVVSSNGSTGIVWILDGHAIALRAYDATNLGNELFSGTLPSYVKFSTPTVANGRVFVGTQHSLEIYGLLS